MTKYITIPSEDLFKAIVAFAIGGWFFLKGIPSLGESGNMIIFLITLIYSSTKILQLSYEPPKRRKK